MIRPLLLTVLVIALSVAGSTTAGAWHSERLWSLSERYAWSDTVVFGEYLGKVKPSAKRNQPNARFRILHVAKSSQAVQIGTTALAFIKSNRKAGERAMLNFNPNPSGDYWVVSQSISRTCFDYALAAPDPEQADLERVPYFLRHLTSSDRQISDDAFLELSRVSGGPGHQ